jgi:hypothetical protein
VFLAVPGNGKQIRVRMKKTAVEEGDVLSFASAEVEDFRAMLFTVGLRVIW